MTPGTQYQYTTQDTYDVRTYSKGQQPNQKKKKSRHPFIFCNVLCFQFCVFLFVIYTPMDVVCPVCMFVYTAVYMLAADGAVFDTPKKKSMVRGNPKRKPTAAELCSRDT